MFRRAWWNETRIVAEGHHVEHWLNGTRVASYDVGSADWNAAVKASKFNPEKFRGFGKAPKVSERPLDRRAGPDPDLLFS